MLDRCLCGVGPLCHSPLRAFTHGEHTAVIGVCIQIKWLNHKCIRQTRSSSLKIFVLAIVKGKSNTFKADIKDTFNLTFSSYYSVIFMIKKIACFFKFSVAVDILPVRLTVCRANQYYALVSVPDGANMVFVFCFLWGCTCWGDPTHLTPSIVRRDAAGKTQLCSRVWQDTSCSLCYWFHLWPVWTSSYSSALWHSLIYAWMKGA